jgi:uncharacterized DUF497 family protein
MAKAESEPTVHPSQAEHFEWDDGNVNHLSQHHVSAREAYQVLENDPVWVRNRNDRAGNWQAFGRTNGGRPLRLICLMREDGTLRVITGWEMNDSERRRFL